MREVLSPNYKPFELYMQYKRNSPARMFKGPILGSPDREQSTRTEQSSIIIVSPHRKERPSRNKGNSFVATNRGDYVDPL